MPVCLERLGGIEIVQILFEIEGKDIQVFDSADRKGIRFSDFIRLIEAFGFTLDRVSGSHHIFKREGIEEMVNIQNYKGEAKPYQTRQFLEIVEKYGLSLEERE